MPVQPSLHENGSDNSARPEPGGRIEIPAELERFAIHYLIARCTDELGDPAPTDLSEAAACLAAGVLEMQLTPHAVIGVRAHSPIGRRLLEVMREELVARWRAYGVTEAQLPVLLLAMERVREAIGNPAAHSLMAHLGGRSGLELLAEVAHDMHSPLASILVLADTLRSEESGPLTDIQRRQLGLISTAALGLSSVGSDIIDLTRSELLLEPTPVPFSVTSVLESVLDIVRPIAEVKGLALRLAPPARDEREGHPVALRRVLLNLTTNALKFTEKGLVEISTREAQPGRIEFAVRDTGRGIEAAMMPTLFDSVRDAPRGHDARGGKVFSSTGLGLTICRKLVESMGSRLHVETQPGRGTRFLFDLELPECKSRRNSGRNSDPNHRRAATPAA